jgi:hypothetical protein
VQPGHGVVGDLTLLAAPLAVCVVPCVAERDDKDVRWARLGEPKRGGFGGGVAGTLGDRKIGTSG